MGSLSVARVERKNNHSYAATKSRDEKRTLHAVLGGGVFLKVVSTFRNR